MSVVGTGTILSRTSSRTRCEVPIARDGIVPAGNVPPIWSEADGNRAYPIEVNLSRWPLGGRDTCELCKSIDVRRWHREGRLLAGRQFSWSWTSGGETSGTIKVRSEVDAETFYIALCVALGDIDGKPFSVAKIAAYMPLCLLVHVVATALAIDQTPNDCGRLRRRSVGFAGR